MTESRRDGRYDGTFDDLFDAHSAAVLAYAARRTPQISDAEDIVAETFVVAWRRLSEVPVEPRAWLYGVARRVLANHYRAGDRRASLLRRLSALATRAPSRPPDEEPALAALGTLSTSDQELLRLVAWEELTHSETAVVLGISVNAVAIRVHRARHRFATSLAANAEQRTKGSDRSRTHTEQWTRFPSPNGEEATR